MKHIGIDYGSKYSGTTAICYVEDKKLHFAQSVKQEDADAFVEKMIKELAPKAVYIDAPLSLPGAYFNKGDDFFFRKCDKELDAKSPMSIGRLTATAMQLQEKYDGKKMTFHETLPTALGALLCKAAGREWSVKHKALEPFCELLAEQLPHPFAEKVENWHQVEAALAWLSGLRHIAGKAEEVGDVNEGIIVY